MKEKRKSIRRAARYNAWIGSDEGTPLRSCIVSDISHTGARLELEKPKEAPETFNLLLSGRGGVHRRCRVVWRGQKEIGVSFPDRRAVQGQPRGKAL